MNPMYTGYPNYGMGYNPMIAQQQQRLNELEQQYPQFAQNPISNPPMQQSNFNSIPNPKNFVKCRAVTSIDEAKASMIDLDGSIHVFTDLGNKKIYTKQINLDGTATLNTYVLQENPEPIPTSAPAPIERQEDLSGYVKQDELEAVCRSFTQQISGLEVKIREYEDLLNHIEEPAPKTRTTSSTSRETKTGGTRK